MCFSNKVILNRGKIQRALCSFHSMKLFCRHSVNMEPYACSVCKKTFSAVSSLVNHVQYHNEYDSESEIHSEEEIDFFPTFDLEKFVNEMKKYPISKVHFSKEIKSDGDSKPPFHCLTCGKGFNKL